ncbi:MAG: putative sulfate transporter [Candidatus Anoxychlamydiales bacterium]|nr:putative sulfate transporter [Candidatus Anoxychlamydiales bacterium]
MFKKIRKNFFFQSRITLLPFKKDIKKYNLSFFKDDIIASFSVALLALPQSIAYSLLANLPPQAGIFSAIFGSIFTGVFGSSKHLVAGPSTGVSILIQTTILGILNTYYPNVIGLQRDNLVIMLLMQIVLLIGIFQIFLALFNLGKILQFVSRSVILGYFAGVSVAIVVNQLYYLFGLSINHESSLVFFKIFKLFTHILDTNLLSLAIGLLSIVLLIFFKLKFKKMPGSIITIALITIVVFFLNPLVSKNFKILRLVDLGMESISKFKLTLPAFDIKMINFLIFPSLAIALLSILEVTSISKNLSAKNGQKIRSNQEIFSVGISNLILSFFSIALPVSGSVSRSTLNYEYKAKTRFSSVYSGLFVAIIIFFLWPLVKLIPLSALAAILIVMVPTIIEPKHIKLCFRATKGDGFVFSLTMISCLIFSLDIAFFIGIVISILFYLKRAAVPHLVEYAFDSSGRLIVISPNKLMHRKVRIIGISGELFFAAVELVQNTIRKVMKDPFVEVIILRLNRVYHVDASMCFAILRLYDYLKTTSRYLIISGVTEEVWQIFENAGVVKQLGSENIFTTQETNPQLSTWRAAMRAKDLLEE